MTKLLAILIDGSIYAAWVFLMGLGMTLIYGVMKILNIAHGSLYALGAYMSVSLIGFYYATGSLPPMLGYAMLPLAAIAVGLIAGLLIERGVLRFMYGRDEVVMLLVTYSIFLFLEDAAKLIWGVDPYFAYQPMDFWAPSRFWI